MSYDEEFEFATLTLASPAVLRDLPTRHRPTPGSSTTSFEACYRSSFKDGDGVEHVIATSQCQATDARRVFPGWDEPDIKATFQTTMVIAAGLEAYSNTRR